jgi:hypothetical protein
VSRTSLKLVPRTDDALRTLLTERDECERRISEIDREMLAYRKAYAGERGEFLLPSIERLRRELIA